LIAVCGRVWEIAAAVPASFFPGISAACGPGCSTTMTFEAVVVSPLSIRA
jgi:hypothetical protein